MSELQYPSDSAGRGLAFNADLDVFPAADTADAEGLLLLGGELSPDWLLSAYRRGIFPWPVEHENQEILAWFSPDPRTILEFDQLHIARRLQRKIRSGRFNLTFNRAFRDVITACAQVRREDDGTWITASIIDAYQVLHELQHAHSVEVWLDERLVGGLYGVAVGGFFSGESMFHRENDASKIALVGLVQRLQSRGFELFDVQQSSTHIQRMGAVEIPRQDFLRRLKLAISRETSFD